jgi:hypothetical protein
MSEPPRVPPPSRVQPLVSGGRYGRYVGCLALVLIALITLNTVISAPVGSSGIKPGRQMPPFAVPLATSDLVGDADIASRANQGAAGHVPACRLRGAKILNICELYERGPVVLVLFVSSAGCTRALDRVQAALAAFPGLQAAGVAIRGSRGAARRLVASKGLRFPVGYDRDGALANVYSVAACPQITLAYPGGVVAEQPLLRTPTAADLSSRLQRLYAVSLTQGWKPPAR